MTNIEEIVQITYTFERLRDKDNKAFILINNILKELNKKRECRKMIDFRSRAMLLFDSKKEISPKLKYQINFGEISEFQAHSNKPTYFIP